MVNNYHKNTNKIRNGVDEIINDGVFRSYLKNTRKIEAIQYKFSYCLLHRYPTKIIHSSNIHFINIFVNTYKINVKKSYDIENENIVLFSKKQEKEDNKYY